MFRAKIIAAFVIFMGLFLGLSYFLVKTEFESSIRSNQSTTIEIAARTSVEINKIETASLHEKADFFSHGVGLYNALQGEGALNEEGELNIGERHLKTHEKLRVQDILVKDIIKAAKGKLAASRLPIESELKLNLAFVLDDKGVGVAALGKDLYKWFGDDVAKSHPMIGSALEGKWQSPKTAYWMWSYFPDEPKRLYEVVIAPVRRKMNDEIAGVVVVGRFVDDGKANRLRKKMFGAESTKTMPDIAFLKGGKIVGSTLDTASQGELVSQLSAIKSGKVTLKGVEYDIFENEIDASEESMRIAVFSKPDLNPVQSLTMILLILGVVLIVLGLAVLFFIVVGFFKPMEELENGIHQVIAGNRDYIWEQEKGHPLQSGFAHALNVMSAFLQGKSMPDDDDPNGGWGDINDASQRRGPKPKVQGVALPGMSPKPKKDA